MLVKLPVATGNLVVMMCWSKVKVTTNDLDRGTLISNAFPNGKGLVKTIVTFSKI